MMIDEVFAERISKSLGTEMSAVGRPLHVDAPCAIIVVKIPLADNYTADSLASVASKLAQASAIEYYARGMRQFVDPRSPPAATFDCKSCGGHFVGKPSTKQGYCLACVEDFRAQDREMLEDRIGPKFNVADRQEAAAATLREARKDTLEAEKRCREEVARDWPGPSKDLEPVPVRETTSPDPILEALEQSQHLLRFGNLPELPSAETNPYRYTERQLEAAIAARRCELAAKK